MNKIKFLVILVVLLNITGCTKEVIVEYRYVYVENEQLGENIPVQESVFDTVTWSELLESVLKVETKKVESFSEFVEPTPTITPADIFSNAKSAFVTIQVKDNRGKSWGGSGFVVCSTGRVVTNHHVMRGYSEAWAIFHDGTRLNITNVLLLDAENDFALVQLDAQDRVFDYMIISDSDLVRPGDLVYALGSPAGDQLTFTDGMVSRIVKEPKPIEDYEVAGLIQHTAAIYGGNSGGPLFNDKGQVIGTNSFVDTVRASVQWAVPSNRIVIPLLERKSMSLPVWVESVELPPVEASSDLLGVWEVSKISECGRKAKFFLEFLDDWTGYTYMGIQGQVVDQIIFMWYDVGNVIYLHTELGLQEFNYLILRNELRLFGSDLGGRFTRVE